MDQRGPPDSSNPPKHVAALIVEHGDADLAGANGDEAGQLPLTTLCEPALEGSLNRPGFTGGQNSRRIARYGTESKEDLEAVFT